MIRYIILFTLFIAHTNLFAQHHEKVMLDSTHYYYKLVPKSKPAGTIIILHEGSEDALGVMKQVTSSFLVHYGCQ